MHDPLWHRAPFAGTYDHPWPDSARSRSDHQGLIGSPPEVSEAWRMRRIAISLSVLILLAAGGGYGYFLYQTRDINRDQAQVEALAAELLPGARPIPGTRGVAAMDKDGLRIAVLAPSLRKARPDRLEGQDLRFVIVGLGKPANLEAVEKIRDQISEMEQQKLELGISKISSTPEMLKAGGKPHPAMHTLSEIGAGGPKLSEHATIFSPRKSAVILIIDGPEASFNQAGMQQFLDGLDTPGLPEDLLAEARARIAAEVRAEVKDRVGEVRAEAQERVGEAKAEARAHARERIQEKEAAVKEQARREIEAKVKSEVESRAREAAETRIEEVREERRQRREGPPGPPPEGPLRRLRDR